MKQWIRVAHKNDFSKDAGGCVMIGNEQIAIFNFGRNEWYAVQNLCPHQQQMVLARGLIGDHDGEPKVACPLHKNQFSLRTGKHLGGREDFQLKTYGVKEENEMIFVEVEE